ncbi:hypothetical protein ABT009_22050 [Streptomyces sp. NPDC002896]|uniref:hypothetical protein n=1 Tax=Streptomyces sp. NPDC002896 TaxID=3154438 RepID=UPI00331BC5E9
MSTDRGLDGQVIERHRQIWVSDYQRAENITPHFKWKVEWEGLGGVIAVPLFHRRVVRACRVGNLAHYKIPRYVPLTDEFPMTVTGKIRKVAMRTASLDLPGLQQDADTAK